MQLVLKPVLGLKGELWVCWKSQKISTASDQYFMSCVKKTTGGGVKFSQKSLNENLETLLSIEFTNFLNFSLNFLLNLSIH